MKTKNELSPKMELGRSALEMVKAARRLVTIKKGDSLWAGTCKETLKHLPMLERQIHKQRKRSGSETRIEEIAKELAHLIGHLCKSLIRCKYHFQMKCSYMTIS